ncbi:serine protease [Paenibacillus campinasensis]|uniref:Serine protease n=1 Tax=Paenibacillus campinasensis TaxID=66347 RepID=A0ABW9SY96_9BACL|nr:CAP domain-containing protein [Paenibacillus campinasensis]MUG65985.1 serine protease [Paenibacillus campinasensis]
MSKHNFKKIAGTTGIAAVLAVGMLLPQTASAAPAKSEPIQNYQQAVQKLLEGQWWGKWLIQYQVELPSVPGKGQAVDKPSAEVPAEDKPAANKPSAEKPTPSKPSTDQPSTSQPDKPKAPVAETPSASQPESSQPGSGNNAAPSRPSAPAQPADTTDQSSFAAQVVKLVNDERAKAGLSPLTVHDRLTTMAVDKAKDMSDNNYFSHTSPTHGSPFDMMKAYGISYRYAGENIAMGQRSAEEVMNAWMNSQGHRENILSPNFTMIGVGYYNGYWVQEFISQ